MSGDFVGPTSDLDDATPWTEDPAAEDAANEPDALERLRLLGRRAARQVQVEAWEAGLVPVVQVDRDQLAAMYPKPSGEVYVTRLHPGVPMRRECVTLRGPR